MLAMSHVKVCDGCNLALTGKIPTNGDEDSDLERDLARA
jgi:hypothetical protein